MIDKSLREMMGDAYRLLEQIEEPVVTNDEDINGEWWRDAYRRVDEFNQKWNQEAYREISQDLSTAFYKFAERKWHRKKGEAYGEQQSILPGGA